MRLALPARPASLEPGLPAVEVTFVTYRRNGQQSGFAAAAIAAGIPVIEIPERGRWDLKVVPELRRIVRDFKPDILETHNIKSHFLVRATGLHREFPWIAWNHGYTSKNRLDRAYNQIDRWSLRRAYRPDDCMRTVRCRDAASWEFRATSHCLA